MRRRGRWIESEAKSIIQGMDQKVMKEAAEPDPTVEATMPTGAVGGLKCEEDRRQW